MVLSSDEAMMAIEMEQERAKAKLQKVQENTAEKERQFEGERLHKGSRRMFYEVASCFPPAALQ